MLCIWFGWKPQGIEETKHDSICLCDEPTQHCTAILSQVSEICSAMNQADHDKELNSMHYTMQSPYAS